MKISLVGAGYWGSKLKAELETIPGVDEMEIIDIKEGKDLKDIKYDNVILATPAWDHHTQTIKLLQQDKNVYVEKPLSLTCTECREERTLVFFSRQMHSRNFGRTMYSRGILGGCFFFSFCVVFLRPRISSAARLLVNIKN